MHFDIFLGNVILGVDEDSLVSLHNMRKATQEEVKMMKKAGMKVEDDEIAYMGEPVEVFGPSWYPLVIVRGGKVVMITIQRIDNDKEITNTIWGDAVTMYTNDLGKPTKQSDNQLVWDLSHKRRVVLGKRNSIVGLEAHAVNIVLSCADPNNLPPTNYDSLFEDK